jgi:predicted ester cyclase
MSVAENKVFIRRYLEAMSGQDKTRALQDEYIADSDEELKGHIIFFEASFPRYEVIADDMTAEGDKVAVLARFRGTHKGELLGIAPTGKGVEVPFAITYRLAGGKIAQHWMSFDRMALMEQLGVIPAPESTK